jgi:hypothetical protein
MTLCVAVISAISLKIIGFESQRGSPNSVRGGGVCFNSYRRVSPTSVSVRPSVGCTEFNLQETQQISTFRKFGGLLNPVFPHSRVSPVTVSTPLLTRILLWNKWTCKSAMYAVLQRTFLKTTFTFTSCKTQFFVLVLNNASFCSF